MSWNMQSNGATLTLDLNLENPFFSKQTSYKGWVVVVPVVVLTLTGILQKQLIESVTPR